MEKNAVQTLDWMNQGLLLAQAGGDMADWLAPVVLVVVILIVVGLAVASRKGAAEAEAEEEVPKKAATKSKSDKPLDPTVSKYTTDLSEIRRRMEDASERAKIEAIAAKDPDDWTIAEKKLINLAKQIDPDLGSRTSAVVQTKQAREEHQSLSGTNEQEETPAAEEPAEQEPPKEDEGKSFEDGLNKTRDGFSKEFFGLFKGKEELDEDLRDAIEEFLYTSDIGAKAATKIMAQIDRTRDEVKRDPSKVWEFVRRYITEEMLAARESKLDIEKHNPFVMLIVGVNGAGKTTTIGKLASRFKRQGKKVLVVAGDTFRAAAVEQLEVWTERVDVPIHKGKSEADPASVVFDGIERGVKEGFDVILCDTSGRLHTDVKLMDELKKIERVSGKALEGAPHETVLVLDANSGQNAVAQAKTFGGALDVTGLILTKLDGTARGGVIMGIGEELDVPVRYVGIGEGIRDLREFDAREFADALFL